MALAEEQKLLIENVLKESLRNKFRNYCPEPASMPFHTRLLGKDRLALYSFVHSLNTNFGTTIFEPVALELTKTGFANAESQSISGREISSEAHRVIQNIMDNLSTAQHLPDKISEIEKLRGVCRQGIMQKVKLTKVDLKITGNDGEIYLFDIKTAKPNAGAFKEFKRTLLEWVAAALASNPEARIQTFIAIPYNPYHPKPYSRWTMRGMIDINHELKVAEEFWDFLGGEGAFDELLDIFEKTGIELRTEIDSYFAKFNKP